MSEVVGTPKRRLSSGLWTAAVALAVPVVALVALAATPSVSKATIGTDNLLRYTTFNTAYTGCRGLGTAAARRTCKRDLRASLQQPITG